MGQTMPNDSEHETYDSDPVQRLVEIAGHGSLVWLELAGRWYERAKSRPKWSAADVVGDCTDLVEHLTPLAERTIDLTIEAMRPYARPFKSGAGSDESGRQRQKRVR